MKKRDKVKQDKLHKVTTKRALYEKARRRKAIAAKQHQIETKNQTNEVNKS